MSKQTRLESDRIHEKVKTQIYTEKFQDIKLSYCYLKKLNESGTSHNVRFVILNHGNCLGYNNGLENNQILPFGSRSAIPHMKYIVKLSEVIRVQYDEKNLFISFYFGNEKKLWDFECPSETVAQEWAKILLSNIQQTKHELMKQNGNDKKQTLKRKSPKSKQKPPRPKNAHSKGKNSNNNSGTMAKKVVKNNHSAPQNIYPYLNSKIEYSRNKSQSQQVVELRKQVERLKQALLIEKLKHNQHQTDADKQEDKDFLVNQLCKFMQKCKMYEQQISQLKQKYEPDGNYSAEPQRSLENFYFQGGFQ